MPEKRIAILSILIEDRQKSGEVNAILSSYGDYAVGRMGIPYRQKDVYVICFVIDAPLEEINALTGKIGMIKGVKAKTIVAKQ